MFKTQVEPLYSRRRVVSRQSFEHFYVISLVGKTTDHGNCCRFVFLHNNTDSFKRLFPLKILGKLCAREREK